MNKFKVGQYVKSKFILDSPRPDYEWKDYEWKGIIVHIDEYFHIRRDDGVGGSGVMLDAHGLRAWTALDEEMELVNKNKWAGGKRTRKRV
jgi:hypothetical protein